MYLTFLDSGGSQYTLAAFSSLNSRHHGKASSFTSGQKLVSSLWGCRENPHPKRPRRAKPENENNWSFKRLNLGLCAGWLMSFDPKQLAVWDHSYFFQSACCPLFSPGETIKDILRRVSVWPCYPTPRLPDQPAWGESGTWAKRGRRPLLLCKSLENLLRNQDKS